MFHNKMKAKEFAFNNVANCYVLANDILFKYQVNNLFNTILKTTFILREIEL